MRKLQRCYRVDRWLLNGAFLTACGVLAAVSGLSQTTAKTSVNGANSAQDYGKLPLAFEANHGQTDASVKFLSRGYGYSLFLTDSEAVLALSGAGCKVGVDKHETMPDACKPTQDSVRMKLAGATTRRAATVTGEAELPGKVNYFIGNDPTKWHSDLPTFAKVRYSRVYPGIDLVYYGKQGQLEYDFVVAPGANAAAIQLSFTGEKSLSIAANGDLVLSGEHGSATFHKPVVYQEKDGQRQPIAGSFQLAANHSVGFSLGTYDHTRALVIDPVLVYSSYLGGSGTGSNGDQGNAIAVDPAGNAYVVGTTFSANFPVTTGAFQAQSNATAGSSTVFVSKLNPAGTELVYSTYLGGSGGDSGFGIALDAANNAYVTGATYSTDFPVTCGAFQIANPSLTTGAATGFVTKLNTTGNALAYSTYLGGSGNQASPAHGDVAQAIAVRGVNAYVTGYTFSADFPVTAGVFQSNFDGNAKISNVFVTKLDGNGATLVYSSYLGGNGDAGSDDTGSGDVGNTIAVDSYGDAFVAGSTSSRFFPVTSGAADVVDPGGVSGFVTKVNPTGTEKLYSTFIGGNFDDSVQALAIDGSGNAYVAGNTSSFGFPTTSNVLEPSEPQPGNPIAFVTKINPAGSAWVYSTFLEGSSTAVSGLAVDSSGAVYVTGSAPTATVGVFGGFVTTPDALATPSSTTKSAFVVKLDPSATVLNYATLFGGSSTDGGIAIALDGSGGAYVTGFAQSTDFPVTSGAYQTTNKAVSGGRNAFIAKLNLTDENNQTAYPSPSDSPPYDTETDLDIQDYGVTNPFSCGDFANYVMTLEVDIYSLSLTSTLPLTGTLALTLPGFGTGTGPIDASGPSYSLYDDGIQGTVPPGIYPVTASYSGDANYNPSSISWDVDLTCPPPPTSDGLTSGRAHRSAAAGQHLKLPLTPRTRSSAKAAEKSAVGLSLARPKFQLPAITQSQSSQRSLNGASARSQATASCQAPLPALTVTVHSYSRRYGAANPQMNYTVTGLLHGDTVAVTPQTTATTASPAGSYPIAATVTGAALANYNLTVVDGTLTVSPAPLTVTLRSVSRLYGAINPALGYFTVGLVNGDTVTVTESTTATTSSPVGSYPITATVTSPALSNYALTVIPGTLFVRPATLHIVALNVAVVYGQTPPPPTAYKLTGFVNGDSAAVVFGAPTLSTTVTATTPPGLYKIGIQTGTLTAPNYIFTGVSNGEGSVDVTRAPLALKANNLIMTQGSAVPTLTYTLTGFVNGQSAAGTVTGAPVLSTTATSASSPGHYPITITQGSMASANYYFVRTNGILTVTH